MADETLSAETAETTVTTDVATDTTGTPAEGATTTEPQEPPAEGAETPETGADTTPPETPAIPPEAQAAVDELAAIRQAWGNDWEIRDIALDVTRAFLRGGTPDQVLESFSKASGPRAYELVHGILEASAAEHVAKAHGISPRELETRLAPAQPIVLPRSLETAIDSLPEEHAKVLRDFAAQHQRALRERDDAKAALASTEQRVTGIQESVRVQQWVQDFSSWQTQAIRDLADVPEKALPSVVTATRELFRSDEKAASAVSEYEAAVLRGEPPRVLARYAKDVQDELRRIVAHEVTEVRGYTKAGAEKPKTDPTPKPTAKTKTNVIPPKPGEQPPAKPGDKPAAPAAEEKPLWQQTPEEAAKRIFRELQAEKAAKAGQTK